MFVIQAHSGGFPALFGHTHINAVHEISKWYAWKLSLLFILSPQSGKLHFHPFLISVDM